MLFFLDETRLGQLAFELAQDLLLRQTLPPEFNQSVHLLFTLHSFYTFATFAIKLVDKHFYESSNVPKAAQSGGCRAISWGSIIILGLLLVLICRQITSASLLLHVLEGCVWSLCCSMNIYIFIICFVFNFTAIILACIDSQQFDASTGIFCLEGRLVRGDPTIGLVGHSCSILVLAKSIDQKHVLLCIATLHAQVSGSCGRQILTCVLVSCKSTLARGLRCGKTHHICSWPASIS